MENKWARCKNILCIRADNLGDLLMSSPAIRALKTAFSARITVLTSSMAAGIAPFIPEIDEVIVGDLPWVKTDDAIQPEALDRLITDLRGRQFDAAVIFTVYSQSPLPAAMLAFQAGIPLRLAYCHENPYGLLTHWMPDEEPFRYIKHQVQRDLDLVANVGAITEDHRLSLRALPGTWASVRAKLSARGINTDRPWLILHAGVSEDKRRYPEDLWIGTARSVINVLKRQVLFTGSATEELLTQKLQLETGEGAFSLGGMLSLTEFISLIRHSPLVISVNTATMHIAAALDVPLIVLYALSNPQHAPWLAYGRVLPFSIRSDIQSKNQIIQYVNEKHFAVEVPFPGPREIVEEASLILKGKHEPVPELIFPA